MKKINTDNYTVRKIGIQRIRPRLTRNGLEFKEFDLDSQGMEEDLLLHDT
jgi:hypothetical protein